MNKEISNNGSRIADKQQEVVIFPPLSADVSLKHNKKMAEAGNRTLIACFLGIFGCYFVYGLLQETM